MPVGVDNRAGCLLVRCHRLILWVLTMSLSRLPCTLSRFLSFVLSLALLVLSPVSGAAGTCTDPAASSICSGESVRKCDNSGDIEGTKACDTDCTRAGVLYWFPDPSDVCSPKPFFQAGFDKCGNSYRRLSPDNGKKSTCSCSGSTASISYKLPYAYEVKVNGETLPGNTWHGRGHFPLNYCGAVTPSGLLVSGDYHLCNVSSDGCNTGCSTRSKAFPGKPLGKKTGGGCCSQQWSDWTPALSNVCSTTTDLVQSRYDKGCGKVQVRSGQVGTKTDGVCAPKPKPVLTICPGSSKQCRVIFRATVTVAPYTSGSWGFRGYERGGNRNYGSISIDSAVADPDGLLGEVQGIHRQWRSGYSSTLELRSGKALPASVVSAMQITPTSGTHSGTTYTYRRTQSNSSDTAKTVKWTGSSMTQAIPHTSGSTFRVELLRPYECKKTHTDCRQRPHTEQLLYEAAVTATRHSSLRGYSKDLINPPYNYDLTAGKLTEVLDEVRFAGTDGIEVYGVYRNGGVSPAANSEMFLDIGGARPSASGLDWDELFTTLVGEGSSYSAVFPRRGAKYWTGTERGAGDRLHYHFAWHDKSMSTSNRGFIGEDGSKFKIKLYGKRTGNCTLSATEDCGVFDHPVWKAVYNAGEFGTNVFGHESAALNNVISGPDVDIGSRLSIAIAGYDEADVGNLHTHVSVYQNNPSNMMLFQLDRNKVTRNDDNVFIGIRITAQGSTRHFWRKDATFCTNCDTRAMHWAWSGISPQLIHENKQFTLEIANVDSLERTCHWIRQWDDCGDSGNKIQTMTPVSSEPGCTPAAPRPPDESFDCSVCEIRGMRIRNKSSHVEHDGNLGCFHLPDEGANSDKLPVLQPSAGLSSDSWWRSLVRVLSPFPVAVAAPLESEMIVLRKFHVLEGSEKQAIVVFLDKGASRNQVIPVITTGNVATLSRHPDLLVCRYPCAVGKVAGSQRVKALDNALDECTGTLLGSASGSSRMANLEALCPKHIGQGKGKVCKSWTEGAWTSCSAGTPACDQTSSGTQTRTVTCPTGKEVDCCSPKPDTSQACTVTGTPCTPGCDAWTTSAWGTCSAANPACDQTTQGTQRRTVSCPSNNCCGTQPTKSQSCTRTGSSCCSAWTTGNWGSCNASSPSCGQTTYGTKSRTVSCPSGNCCGTAPSDSQSCSRTGSTCPPGCSAWTIGSWGSCSASSPSCGQTTYGTKTRSVSCSTSNCCGTEPSTSRSCSRSGGACCNGTWNTGSWGSCSASTPSCGQTTYGTQTRTVSCSTDCCLSSKPSTSTSCSRTGSPCCNGSWSTGSWGSCSASTPSCGQTTYGTQTRTVTCSTSCCKGSEPTGSKSCSKTGGTCCTSWSTGSWGSCSAAAPACGTITHGTQTRTVSCSSGNCCGSAPSSSKQCSRTGSPCCNGSWSTGSWGSCSASTPSCGQTTYGTQTRTVTCSTSCCKGSEPTGSKSCSKTGGTCNTCSTPGYFYCSQTGKCCIFGWSLQCCCYGNCPP